MTGYERILAAFDGSARRLAAADADHHDVRRRSDRRAVWQYAADHRVLVEAQIRTAEKFDFDYVSCISDPAREAADCGATIQYFDDQPPAIDETGRCWPTRAAGRAGGPRPAGRRADARPRAGGGPVPPASRRREADRGLDRRACAEAADLRGINRLMTDFFDDPAFVRDLFDFVLGDGAGVRPGPGRRRRGPDRRGRRRRLAGRPANLRGVRLPLRAEDGRRPCTRWARRCGCTSAATSAASWRASAGWAARSSTSTTWCRWPRRGGRWGRSSLAGQHRPREDAPQRHARRRSPRRWPSAIARPGRGTSSPPAARCPATRPRPMSRRCAITPARTAHTREASRSRAVHVGVARL